VRAGHRAVAAAPADEKLNARSGGAPFGSFARHTRASTLGRNMRVCDEFSRRRRQPRRRKSLSGRE